jgi:hypothetical protein
MSNSLSKPLILGFVTDLIFVTRIESVAERLNFRVTWIERPDQIAPADTEISSRQFAEPVSGYEGTLVDKLTQWKPCLIIFDLDNTQIPWRRWVALIKSASATRRIPVVCFGSHKDVDNMRAAQSAGADAVLARSRFVEDLPGIIHKHVHMHDEKAWRETCQAPLSQLALQGLELFNRGEYFEAHELLEEAWNEDQTQGRELYRAILQIAVAYLHIQRGNYNGAIKMFLRVRQWIDPLPDHCRGVEVTQLRQDARIVHEKLVALGRDRMAELDPGLLRPVRYSGIF